MRNILLVLCIALSCGCASSPSTKKIKSDYRIVYEIPSENADKAALYSGIGFETRAHSWVEANTRYERTAEIIAKDDSRCEVAFNTRSSTAEGSPVWCRQYLFKVKTSRAKGITKVEFRPYLEIVQPIICSYAAKPSQAQTLENATELLATSGTFTFRFEVPSGHTPKSVVKNLRKFLKEQLHPNPVTIMSRQFNSSYLLTSGNLRIATFYVSFEPRPKGSNTVVIAKLRLAPDANYRIDAYRQVHDVKKLISDIVTE